MGAPVRSPDDEMPLLDIRSYIEDLLVGPAFARSARRGRLLEYLVDLTLTGRGGQINEFSIGLDALGKPPSFDTRIDSSVRAEMSRLRRALAEYYRGPGRDDPWRIEFPQRGYVPVFLPACRVDPVARPAQRASTPAWMRWIAVAAVAIGIALAVLWRIWPSHGALRSVVVLPFANLTGDPGLEYLADGVTEELTDSLARTPDFEVVARTSAFQFKGKGVDVRQVGRQLGVDAVVEGSVRKFDDRLRLTVQVNRARDGYHIVSQSFDGDQRELGRLERNLAAPVRAALHPGAEVPQTHVPSGGARELFLKADAIRGQGSPEAFRHAVEYLDRAIESDPLYADAYAALAGVYAGAAVNFTPNPLEYVPSAKAAAAKALELDPRSGRAYAALGYLDSLVLLDWKRGEQELRAAVRLLPSARHWLGVTLLAQGRFEEAIQELRAAEKSDPLSPAAGAMVGQALYMARRYDDALLQFNKVLQLHPDVVALHPHLGAVYEAKGEYDKAMAEYDIALVKMPPVKERIAHLWAVTGKRGQALPVVNELEHPPAGQEPDAFSMAILRAALGDHERAFEWLEQAYQARKIALLKVHPMLDPLRTDPRYHILLKRAGLE